MKKDTLQSTTVRTTVLRDLLTVPIAVTLSNKWSASHEQGRKLAVFIIMERSLRAKVVLRFRIRRVCHHVDTKMRFQVA